MEITDVKTFLCEARPGSARYYSFVKVCTDEGLTGVGESFGWGIGPAVTEAVVKQFKRVLVGQDPLAS
jgi:galactonate dehydratase